MLRILVFYLFLFASNATVAADYDVLIRKGLIYDGTGAPPFVADIAISGDQIAAIGQLSGHSADLEIDASELAVAPGFFNLLSHAHLSLISDGRAMSDVLQGVTFEVLSEISLSPVTKTTAEFWSGMFAEEEVELSWSSLGRVPGNRRNQRCVT